MSQDALAARVAHVPGLKQSHLSKFERRIMLPTGEQHDAIATALQLPDEDRELGRVLLRREHLQRLHLLPTTATPPEHRSDAASDDSQALT
jgi:hypothetical protein